MPRDIPEITCVSPMVRAAIRTEVQKIASASERQTFLRLLSEMADCDNGGAIGFEVPMSSSNGKKRQKRARSKYQEFVSTCMKGGEKSMGRCASEWQTTKKERG